MFEDASFPSVEELAAFAVGLTFPEPREVFPTSPRPPHHGDEKFGDMETIKHNVRVGLHILYGTGEGCVMSMATACRSRPLCLVGDGALKQFLGFLCALRTDLMHSFPSQIQKSDETVKAETAVLFVIL